ncbi:hypothetical protein HMPREF1544_06286, partial [Mucor circinelloides 1006PhL]
MVPLSMTSWPKPPISALTATNRARMDAICITWMMTAPNVQYAINVERYDSKGAASQQIRLLSLGDIIISKLLSNDRVRQDLRHRATY